MAKVLIIGGDASLLETRAAVLRRHSFAAEILVVGSTTISGISAENAPDLFVLCSSLSLQLRKLVRALIEDCCPAIPVLTVLKAAELATEPGHLERSEGPAGMVRRSLELTRSV